MDRQSSFPSPKRQRSGNKKLAGNNQRYLQRIFDSIPGEIDAIKAEKRKAAIQLRRFVRKLEETGRTE